MVRRTGHCLLVLNGTFEKRGYFSGTRNEYSYLAQSRSPQVLCGSTNKTARFSVRIAYVLPSLTLNHLSIRRLSLLVRAAMGNRPIREEFITLRTEETRIAIVRNDITPTTLAATNMSTPLVATVTAKAGRSWRLGQSHIVAVSDATDSTLESP